MKDIEGLDLRFANPALRLVRPGRPRPGLRPGRLPSRAGRAVHPPGARASSRRSRATIVGLDVVELNPARDASGITAAAAFKIIQETAGRMVRP